MRIWLASVSLVYVSRGRLGRGKSHNIVNQNVNVAICALFSKHCLKKQWLNAVWLLLESHNTVLRIFTCILCLVMILRICSSLKQVFHNALYYSQANHILALCIVCIHRPVKGRKWWQYYHAVVRQAPSLLYIFCDSTHTEGMKFMVQHCFLIVTKPSNLVDVSDPAYVISI